MTTVEKLLVQIFERKKSILEQVNQQTELYRQYLVSKSLIDGITPPSWLWNPNTSDSEGISELNKDELISKLLCPYPQSSARWSFAHYPGYNNLVITGDNEELCDRVPVENPVFSKGLNRQDDPVIPALNTDDHAECPLNCVPELDSSVTSPEDRTDERILNIYHAPDQSLAKIKRSKSRQKAFELRSSAKAPVKSGLGHENAEVVVSGQLRFSLSATDQEGQNDELPQSAEPHAIGGQCCEEPNLEEADCTSRERGKEPLELQGSAKAAENGLGYENISDSVSSPIRCSLSATDQSGQNDELTQLAEPCAVGGQSCEEMNLDEKDCTSREQRRDNANNVVSGQFRFSLSATDQEGQNDELPQSAEPHAIGGQCCEETSLEEADCTSRERGEEALELQGSAKAAESGLGYENISDSLSSPVRCSLCATDQSVQNDELTQLAESCAVGGQSCEEMNLDEKDCTSREQRCENASNVVSGQFRFSLSATDQAGQNDELTECVAEPRAFGGQCCEEMNLEEAVCTSRERGEETLELQVSAKTAKSGLRYENISDVVSGQTRFSLPATDQARQNDKLHQLAEPCAVSGQSCEELNLDEADCTSSEMEIGTYSDMVTRSRRHTEVPISVKGSLTLDCSSEECKENDFYHVVKAKRTESMPISHSELADINFSISVGPSDVSRQSCGDRRIGDASFPIKDQETNVCTDKFTMSNISRKRLSCGSDYSKDDNSFDNYQGTDIPKTDAGNYLTPETGDGSLVKINFPNVCNEGCDTRTSISEDSRRYKERDTLSSWSSSQHNTRVDAISNLEASSFSAKVDGGILASSSGVSARQLIDSIEASGSVKPSVGLFRRLTRSQTWCHDKGTYQPVADSENPSFRSPISKPDTRACLEAKVEVCSQHGDSSLRDNVLGTHNTFRLHGENSSLEGSLRHTSMESWPQVKRRKIERQQANSFTTSPSFRVKKHHSIHGGPVSTYWKSMEINADTALVEHVHESSDARIRPEMNSSLKGGNSSEHGEVGSCYKEKNENKTSPSDINNQQLEASPVSNLPLIECRDSQGCFLEGVRTSISSSNLFDARLPGNEQCGEHLCHLEKSADNLNSENLKLSNTLLEGIRFPNWEDGLHRPHPVLSPSNEDLQPADVDQSIPVFEGFIVDSQTNSGELNFAGDGFHFDELNLPRTTLERASILAEICRSASLDRPSYQFSYDFEFQETQNIFQSVPNGDKLEHLDFGDTFPSSSDVGKHLQSGSSSSDVSKDTIDGMPHSVSLAYSGAWYGCNSRNQYPSPVGKLWDRPSSYIGSSGKRLSSNPELTCFPIEEDPSISEENKTVDENAGDMQEEINSSLPNHCDKRKPLKDLTNLNLSVSAEEEVFNTDTMDLVSPKVSVTGTQKKAHCGPRGSKYQYRNKSQVSENQTSSIGTVDGRTNQPSCIGANRIKKAKESTNSSICKSIVSNKTSLKGHDQKLSLKESTRNNIVSNVSSFIPLVQQKQAATACTGKRDVKVKALEAAEAAKRLEEKKENERKLRKEAMKLERAKLEEKNLRHMELEKKKKEEKRKKKDADIMAKKRLREEEEKKEKERKRMRPDAKQRQREKEEKKRAEKAEKGENHRSKDHQINSKESHDEPKKQQSETSRGDGVTLQKAETESTLTGVVMNHGECGTSVIPGEVEKAMHSVDRSPKKEDLIAQNNQGKSYEISPYQCSDDEDEEDDELPTKKFIPSWASKNSVAMFLPLLQKLDPDVIFPLESFCSMDEVLLPRKLQQSQVGT
ncbi:hypothetical protein ACS0TY_032513 [Phlomoides rotata]